MKNTKRFIAVMVVLHLFSFTLALAGETNPAKELDYVTMGDTKIPIMARSDIGVVCKIRGQFFGIIDHAKEKPDDSMKIISDCGLFGAQGYFLKEQSKALAIYEKCLSTYPDNAKLNRGAGLLSMALGEKKKALGYLQKASQAMPDDPLTTGQLGDALMLNQKNVEAKEQYEKAIALGHYDVDLMTARINKLVPMTDARKIERYILGFTGGSVDDGMISEFLYHDSKKKLPESTYFFKKKGAIKTLAAIDTEGIQKRFSGWKKLNAYLDTQKENYMKKRTDLEQTLKEYLKRDRKKVVEEVPIDRATVENELMRLIVENEALQVTVRGKYSTLVKKTVRRVAEEKAIAGGYDAVIEFGIPVQAKDITADAISSLESDQFLAIDPAVFCLDAQSKIVINENNLKPEEFFKK